MTSLVGMLLSLARADAGQLTPNREPVDLADLARDVAEQLDLIAHEHELTITTDLTSVTASVDPDMIIQVLVNLIDNAIKNTPSGGVVTVRLQETDARPPALSPAVQPARGSNRAALITVADSGIGIAEEHLPHIFDRFYRVEGGRARSHGGSGGIGLGLAICQAIAHAHGATLTAASTPGEGATFTLTIPLVV